MKKAVSLALALSVCAGLAAVPAYAAEDVVSTTASGAKVIR